MKKPLLLILILSIGMTVTGQSSSLFYSYKARTYESYSWKSTWEPMGDPVYANIKFTLSGNHMIINSEQPASLKIDGSKVENIRGDGYYGKKYPAFEVIKENRCYIEILEYVNESYLTIGVAFYDQDPQYMVVYYIKRN